MVIDEGKVSATENFGINEHCALIQKMESGNQFSMEMTDEQVQNLATYFVTLPSEAAMLLWTALGKGAQENVIKLHKSSAEDGQKVAARLVTLLTGDEK